jgi:Zn-dependent protease
LPKNALELAELLLRVPVILLALTVHEFCHAYFALRMGDPTGYRLGRCSLNPLRHLDPIGTLCLLFAPIGWAKPVPVLPINFRDPRKGMLVSVAAGPLSNLAQALVYTLLLKLAWSNAHALSLRGPQWEQFADIAVVFAALGVEINIGLAIFNFLPLFPLDGFHIVANLQKPGKEIEFQSTAVYGPFVIAGIVILSRIGKIDLLGGLIHPVLYFLVNRIAGIPAF